MKIMNFNRIWICISDLSAIQIFHHLHSHFQKVWWALKGPWSPAQTWAWFSFQDMMESWAWWEICKVQPVLQKNKKTVLRLSTSRKSASAGCGQMTAYEEISFSWPSATEYGRTLGISEISEGKDLEKHSHGVCERCLLLWGCHGG